jgi:hypothetical protein
MREGIGDFLFLFFRWGGAGKNAERGMKAARRRGRTGAHHRPGRGNGRAHRSADRLQGGAVRAKDPDGSVWSGAASGSGQVAGRGPTFTRRTGFG